MPKKPYIKPKLYELKEEAIGQLFPEHQVKGLKPISRKVFSMQYSTMKDIDWNRHAVMGFSSRRERPDNPTVHPRESFALTAHPQVPFLGQRLAVSLTCAPFFAIESLRVGMNEMTLAPEEIPAEVFSSPREEKKAFEYDEVIDGDGIARGERFDMIPSLPGHVLVLTVRNTDLVNHVFTAAIFGRAPKYW